MNTRITTEYKGTSIKDYNERTVAEQSSTDMMNI